MWKPEDLQLDVCAQSGFCSPSAQMVCPALVLGVVGCRAAAAVPHAGALARPCSELTASNFHVYCLILPVFEYCNFYPI